MIKKFKSFSNILLIFFFIALKNLLNGPEHSLERISVDANNSGGRDALDTSLPRSVSDKSNFTKIVSLVKFKHFFGLFFGNKLSFSNHVEFVSFLPFFDNIVSCIVVLLFQDITELFLLIWVDFRKNRNF